MGIYSYHLSFAITGVDGSAASPTLTSSSANTTTRPLSGRVKSIYVKYNTQPNTTDLVVKTFGANAPSQTLLTLSNKNTDGLFYVLTAASDTSGVAVTYDGTHPILVEPVIDDYVSVTVAQGNAGTIEVWIMVEGQSQ